MIRSLAASLKLSQDVVAKAEEFDRLIKVKRSNGLGAADVARNAVVVGLACEVLHCDFDKEQLMKLGAVSKELYSSTFGVVKALLGVSLTVTIDQLCSAFNCASLTPIAAKILAAYKARRLAALSEALRASARFDAPVFIATAVALAAERRKVKLDVRALCDKVNAPWESYAEVCVKML